MSVAKIAEISAASTVGFEDAIKEGIKRANKTLKNITGVWIQDQKLDVENGEITNYRVIMKVTFVLEY